MTIYEVIAISKDLTLLNEDSEVQSVENVLAETGHIVTVLQHITSKLDHQMASIKFGENHAEIRHGSNEGDVISGDLLTQDDTLRLELRGSGSGLIQLIQPTSVVEGFFVRLARES